MKIFLPLYDRVLRWSRHRYAERYLAGLSFAESSFFPVPPDVMLAPMTLAEPRKGWRFAFITTLSSVLGGVFGYLIGWLALGAIEPVLHSAGYWEAYQRATEWFVRWGFLAVLAAGFSPIPYKVFTIAAGAMHMLLPLFVVASFLGRGARFYMVAGLVMWGGEPMERRLREYVDIIGWATIALIFIGYLIYLMR